MDSVIVCTDSRGVPVGASQDYDLDLDYGFGSDVSNDFSLTVYERSLIPKIGDTSFVYIDGTDVGGVVDRVKDSFTNGIPSTTFSGRTWSGVLAGKVLQPDSNSGQVHITESASGFVGEIIGRCDLTDLMVSAVSGAGTVDVTVPGWSTAWQAIEKMLDLHGMKLLFREDDGTVYLSVEPAQIYTSDSDMIDFTLEKDFRRVNHMIGLGEGRGATRLRCDWYADENGKLSTTQKITGIREIAAVYQDGGGDDDKSGPADPLALTADEKKELKGYDDRAASMRRELKSMTDRHASVIAGYQNTLKSFESQADLHYVQPRNQRWKSEAARRRYAASIAAANRRAEERAARYHATAMARVERERMRIAKATRTYHQQEDAKRKQIADELKKRAADLQKMEDKRKKLIKTLNDNTQKQLKSLQGTGSLTVTVHDGADLDVGDIVQGYDQVHHVKVSASVVRKTITAQHGVLTVTYSVGKNAVLEGGTYEGEGTGDGSNVAAALSPWPVGSIYECAVNKNPRDLLGIGTWVRQPSLGPYTWLRTA